MTSRALGRLVIARAAITADIGELVVVTSGTSSTSAKVVLLVPQRPGPVRQPVDLGAAPGHQPVVVKDHLYGVSRRGQLVCVSLATGKTAWAAGTLGG